MFTCADKQPCSVWTIKRAVYAQSAARWADGGGSSAWRSARTGSLSHCKTPRTSGVEAVATKEAAALIRTRRRCCYIKRRARKTASRRQTNKHGHEARNSTRSALKRAIKIYSAVQKTMKKKKKKNSSQPTANRTSHQVRPKRAGPNGLYLMASGRSVRYKSIKAHCKQEEEEEA